MTLDQPPRVPLTRLPTPLEDAPRLAAALGVARLLVKRDDLTDLALGGNKVRKLEFLLGDALAQGADTLVTTAGAQSNFLRLTAVAARRLGLRAVAVVRAGPVLVPQGNLLLMRLFGMELQHVETQDPFARTTTDAMEAAAAHVRARGGRPYLVHIALWSGGRAALGYVHAASELADQLAAAGVAADHVVLAVGSGGTQAGLLLGLRLRGLQARVQGVSVNLPAEDLERRIAGHVRAAADLLGVRSPVRDDEIHVTDDLVGEGYGIPSPESLAAVRLAAEAEGLLLDPIYTGKAWAGLARAVAVGTVARSSTVVFLHTGGAPHVFLHAQALAVPVSAHRTP
ncbi:MAG: D-cysteine desulfhydrase family protein [Armatimonadota bacterium]|nr:D-cysteine desulfhydrase family protein [Armatimonadota bacterium]